MFRLDSILAEIIVAPMKYWPVAFFLLAPCIGASGQEPSASEANPEVSTKPYDQTGAVTVVDVIENRALTEDLRMQMALIEQRMAAVRRELREALESYRATLQVEGKTKTEVALGVARLRDENSDAYEWLRDSMQTLSELRAQIDGGPRQPPLRTKPEELTPKEGARFDEIVGILSQLQVAADGETRESEMAALSELAAMREELGDLRKVALLRSVAEHGAQASPNGLEREPQPDSLDQQIELLRKEEGALRDSLRSQAGEVDLDIVRKLESVRMKRINLHERRMLEAINERKVSE